MLSKRFVLFAALPVLAAVIQIPAVKQAHNAVRVRPRYHDINRLVSQTKDGTSTSTNWSGYAVTGSAFTRAMGSWIVPAVTCSSGNQYSSFWVGIDGYNSSTVEQTGTSSDCNGKTPNYYAWYEFCCKEPEITISGMTITPGDVMNASVYYNGSNFVLTIKDTTTGQAYRKTGNITGAQRTSAEWIAEAPSSGGVLPLANFGTVVFGKDSTAIPKTCVAVNSTTQGPIGVFPSFFQITMVNNSHNPKAVPSILSSDQSSFSDQWVASQ